MEKKEVDLEELKRSYETRIRKEFGEDLSGIDKNDPISSDYSQFKNDLLPDSFSLYEKLCNFSEKTFKIKPDKKQEDRLWQSIEECHLNATPTGVLSFAILAPLIFCVVFCLITFVIFQSTFLIVFGLLVTVSMIQPLTNIPNMMADDWRMKASNQMVISVFYVVTFMRHTSNLEGAMKFASDHLSPPLSLDFRKVLWDVETEKYESLKESMDNYLQRWKDYAPEFVESFHLIESSLYEGDENRRIELLEKSLDVMLSETYEKMLHYAHELKSPITTLHMLGVILPILGLVMLPLMVSFIKSIRWYHVSALYNFLLPVAVFYFGKTILSKRPTGYGGTDITDTNPKYKNLRFMDMKFGSKTIKLSPMIVAVPILITFLFIGLLPLMIHAIDNDFDLTINENLGFVLLDYKEVDGFIDPVGPYGIGATMLSFSLVVAFGMSIGMYYKIRSTKMMKIREDTKQLENEFSSAIFQLGNRLGDGLPAEMAFGKVATTMSGSVSGKFFELVDMNIRKLGMSVEQAIFDKKYGALVTYPSNIIRSSMKVLTQSVKKGPKIASKALVNVSRYIKEFHRVDERLKDLLAEIMSSISSQIKFMAPVIGGVVVGIGGMISMILGRLGTQFAGIQDATAGSGGGQSLLASFGEGIPTYYLQLVVGLYIVQIVFILTKIANGIENGKDPLAEEYNLSKNVPKSTTRYILVAMFVLLAFNIMAAQILGRFS